MGDKDCDGFQVSRSDHTKNKLCEFRRPYKTATNRHFNYAGQKKTLKPNTADTVIAWGTSTCRVVTRRMKSTRCAPRDAQKTLTAKVGLLPSIIETHRNAGC